MRLNVEQMTDVTMDAALNVVEIEQTHRQPPFVADLLQECTQIERFFGFNDDAVPTLRMHALKKMLREGYPPLAGEHTTYYDPYLRAKRDFEQLVLYAHGSGDHHQARDFCLLLNRIFLGAFARRGNRTYLAA